MDHHSLSPEKRLKLSTTPAVSGEGNLLDRIRSFLPAIQQANEQLQEQQDETTNADPTVLDESDVDDDEDKGETEAADELGSTFKLKLAPDDATGVANPIPLEDPLADDNAPDESNDNLEADKKESVISELLTPSASKKRAGGPLIQEIS